MAGQKLDADLGQFVGNLPALPAPAIRRPGAIFWRGFVEDVFYGDWPDDLARLLQECLYLPESRLRKARLFRIVDIPEDKE